MKMFLGEKVLLDEPFDESITTTTYNRKVNITGVTDLSANVSQYRFLTVSPEAVKACIYDWTFASISFICPDATKFLPSLIKKLNPCDVANPVARKPVNTNDPALKPTFGNISNNVDFV